MWAVPKLWPGRTVAVLASGPSMTPAAAAAVAGLPRIVVNNTFRLAADADILYAADAAWWEQHPDAHAFGGLKVSCEPVRGVEQIGRAGRIGYVDDAAAVHTFGNSGAQAIQIAAKAGAARILLLGFDFRGNHWHGMHPHPLRNTLPELFPAWAHGMRVLAAELQRRGVEVLNCTPHSALDCFARAELAEVLEQESSAA